MTGVALWRVSVDSSTGDDIRGKSQRSSLEYRKALRKYAWYSLASLGHISDLCYVLHFQYI